MLAAVAGQAWAVLPHPYSLEVNGTDLVDYLVSDSLRIDMPGPGTNGSCSFTLADPALACTVTEWDEVVFVEHAAARPNLFGGFVQSVSLRASEGAGRFIEVECAGYGILLDRKVADIVPAMSPVGDTTDNDSIGAIIQSLVGRFGGRISAPGWTSPDTSGYYGSASKTVQAGGEWYKGYTAVQPYYTALSPMSLRSALDSWTADAISFDPPSAIATPAGDVSAPAPALMWVDSYGRLNAMGAIDLDCGYTGDVAANADGSSGAVKMTGIDYTSDGSERALSAYVTGAGTPYTDGTGWVSTGSDDRAGDLSVTVSDTRSNDLYTRWVYGMGEIWRSSPSPVRGDFTAVSETPIDIRPGQRVTITAAKVGLAGEHFRVTSVSISWQSATSRTYDVTFGGSLGAPSFANRSGRYATR